MGASVCLFICLFVLNLDLISLAKIWGKPHTLSVARVGLRYPSQLFLLNKEKPFCKG